MAYFPRNLPARIIGAREGTVTFRLHSRCSKTPLGGTEIEGPGKPILNIVYEDPMSMSSFRNQKSPHWQSKLTNKTRIERVKH